MVLYGQSIAIGVQKAIGGGLPLSSPYHVFPAITNFLWLLLKLPRGTIQTGGGGLQSKQDFNVYLCPESLQILVTARLKAGISLIRVGSSVILKPLLYAHTMAFQSMCQLH